MISPLHSEVVHCLSFHWVNTALYNLSVHLYLFNLQYIANCKVCSIRKHSEVVNHYKSHVNGQQGILMIVIAKPVPSIWKFFNMSHWSMGRGFIGGDGCQAERTREYHCWKDQQDTQSCHWLISSQWLLNIWKLFYFSISLYNKILYELKHCWRLGKSSECVPYKSMKILKVGWVSLYHL